jgi:two-component system nitrate/nitrite response regulator NarL
MTRVVCPLQVAIVEDHTLLAESLDVALTLEGHVVHRQVLDDPSLTSNSLLSSVLRSQAQVVLLDLELGQVGNGKRLIEPLWHAGVWVVVITSSSDRVEWGECLRLGARAVLPKSVPINTVLSMMQHIGEGRAPMAQDVREELMAASRRERSDLHEIGARLEALTPREREVLAHLMAGRAVREIASRGVVAEATVRTQVKSVLAKMQVSSQLAAVALAYRLQRPAAYGAVILPEEPHEPAAVAPVA